MRIPTFACICAIGLAVTTARATVLFESQEDGFTVEMPQGPKYRETTSNSDVHIYQYEAFAPGKPAKFTVIVAKYLKRGIYEPESQDAALRGHLEGMLKASDKAALVSSKRTKTKGAPSLEYQYNHMVEGVPYVARGVTMMVDGGHIRLSAWHPKSDAAGKKEYEDFVGSFAFKHVAYRPAGRPFVDAANGIEVIPPYGWTVEPGNKPNLVATFSNLTRLVQVQQTGTPEINCEALEGQARNGGVVRQADDMVLRGKSFRRVLTSTELPKQKVKVFTVYFCRDTPKGAVVVSGTEEELLFQRWSKVFEGVAATLVVR